MLSRMKALKPQLLVLRTHLGVLGAEIWTAGEHRAPRGAAAGCAEKALKAGKPADGCGVKQSHEVSRGSSR
jgi:hypothetical protein